METTAIIRRALGSLIDKVLILLFFVIAAMSISPYGMPAHLGRYYAYLDISPSSYHSHDIYEAMECVYGDMIYRNPDKWSQYCEEILKKPELIASHKGETLSWDLRITGIFIIVNFVYYLLGGWIFHASLGKFFCGLTIVSSNSKPIRGEKVIKRCFLLLFLMILAVGLRFAFDTNYYMTVLLFILIVDTPVIIKGKSLIDMMTNTYIIKRKNL